MKVEVDKITSDEIEIKENISALSWDMDSFDMKFVDEISLDCKFRRVNKGILVYTEVAIPRIIVCSRCLEEVQQVVKHNFELCYEVNKLGELLEIDDDIREEVLLNFPMKVLCKPDCKGICTGCGVNLNVGKCKCKIS